MENNKQEPMKSLTKFIVFSISMVILYTIIVTILTAITGNDFSTLYSIFCAIFGGEILSCALIKIFKLREENKNG